jgi:hypothetical protein
MPGKEGGGYESFPEGIIPYPLYLLSLINGKRD